VTFAGCICAPRPTLVGIETMTCPHCGGERGFLVEFYEWYGWDVICLACGDSWQDGEMRERPFRPRWRQEEIAKAMKRIERYRDAPLSVRPPVS